MLLLCVKFMLKKGKFIVIDGTDGSGKTTQFNMLKDNLINEGYDVQVADFPQYGTKSAGLVEEYLNGKYGEANDVGPYRASIFYAADRYDASFKIKKWLDEGKIVISNRYVAANMAHQGGKISDDNERQKYFKWLEELEYKIFNIPRPDMNIILHVDAAVAQKLVDKKGHRDYVGGSKRDIHEADIAHLRNAEKVYLEIAKMFKGFELIECTRDNQIMERPIISKMVWAKVSDLLKSEQQLAPNFKILHDQFQATSKQNETTQEKELIIEKLSNEAKLPTKAHESDAGYDLYSVDEKILFPDEIASIKTGIKMKIPEKYAGLIWDKSGLAKRGLKTMGGVIDSGYRGEIIILVKNAGNEVINIEKGQKIAQILIQKIKNFKMTEGKVNDDSSRGDGGFGSSGLF